MNPLMVSLLALGAKGEPQNLLSALIKAVGLGLAILIGLIVFLIEVVILSVVMYIAGLMVVGGRKATFGDAFKISLIGAVLGGLVYGAISLFAPLIGLLVYLLIWLALIKQYFETGWLNALAIGILAVIVWIILIVIVGLVLAIPLAILELFRGLILVYA